MKRYSIFFISIFVLYAKVPTSLSFQGYSGLINIPNAQVLDKNSIAFSINNHFDNHLRFYNTNKKKNSVMDFQFGVSLFKNLEIFGRVKEQKGYARDLSANFKYKFPKLISFLPDIAVGAQDVGGLASLYKSYYIVADKEIKNLRVTLGYGYSKTSRAKRLDGFFGGIEYAVNPYIVGVFDYDGKEKHIGVKLSTPKDWLNGISLETMIAKNLNDKSYSFALSTKFLFDYQKEEVNKIDKSKILKRLNNNLSKDEAIAYLFNLLKQDGFNKIKLYNNSKYLLIRYENSIYRNDADAIFNIIKSSFIVNKYYKNIILQATKSSIVQNNYIVDLNKAIAYYKNPKKSLHFISESNINIENFKLLKSYNTSKLHLEISPILKTFVATEVKLFDYQLLMGLNGYYNLAKGLDVNARYDFKISHSKNFNPKTGVFADSYNKGGLHSLLVHYTFKYNNIINTTSLGLYRYEYFAAINQTSLMYKNHFLNLKFGYFKHKGKYEHIDWQDSKKIFIAKYSYYFKNINASIDIYGGQFWNQDRGFGINFNKYLGDTTLTLKYLQTKPTTYWKFFSSEQTNRYIGLYITIPLDFKKSKTNFKYVQLHGNNNFTYGLRSTIKRKDGSNRVMPGSGDEVLVPTFEHSRYFYHNKRSNIDYLENQQYRVFY